MEKERRIYYQTIVYNICNLLDSPDQKVCCGTVEHPSTEVQTTVAKLIREVQQLRSEVGRLKEGSFTEEEFQNLCHNFTTDDINRFKAGCLSYQKKLFGSE